MVGSTHHIIFCIFTEFSFLCIFFLLPTTNYFAETQANHFYVFHRQIIFYRNLPTTLFYGNLQANHFYVYSSYYSTQIIFYVFSITHPLLLLWKNGKEFLLADLKILKNGFFWKIFSWVWRFMGSGLELFLFLVFVVEGFIVFRSFFDN